MSAVRVVAYCAGKIPPHVPRRMAAAVEEELRKPQWQEVCSVCCVWCFGILLVLLSCCLIVVLLPYCCKTTLSGTE